MNKDVRPRRVRVSIPVFPECDPSIIFGVYDTLWAAGRMWDNIKGGTADGLFEPRLVGVATRPLELITGVSVIPQDTICSIDQTDVVFVPNVVIASSQSPRALDRRMIDWIRCMHQRGASLYAACGGAIVLAETGLLEGHEATTHWSYAPLFKKHYPNVALRIERVLVQSGPEQNLYCAGGASSWQDLALLLVAKHGGVDEAIRMSKLFLYQWHRAGQLPYASMIENVNHGDAVILECQQWIAKNYQRQDIVAELVRRSGLAKRSFDRRFRAATGYSPLAYVQTLRVEEAKQALETNSSPVERIGRDVGYEDAASFRRLFRKLTGMTPGEYRRNFQLPNNVAAEASGNRQPGRSAARVR
ncbi:MAG: transcriptional regulator [Methylocystis sp.]|nr:MAG: transcriptional regulator [Methylocystis sp.]PPD06022.1 MAG: transcriptional regulator [Methylocystis sp.]